MNKSNVKFMHLRTYMTTRDHMIEVNPYGGLTVAFQTDETSNTVKFGVAKVNQKDRYERKIGRSIAEQALIDNAPSKCGIVTMEDIHPMFTGIMSRGAAEKLKLSDINFPLIASALVEKIKLDGRFKKNLKSSV